MSKDYFEKLKDPRWQKKRLEILERDDWCCQICYDSESTLHIHHRRYIADNDPWNYPNTCLVTLCETCHETEKEGIKEALSTLAEQVREKFFSSDIQTIASAINQIKIMKTSEITSEIIE